MCAILGFYCRQSLNPCGSRHCTWHHRANNIGVADAPATSTRLTNGWDGHALWTCTQDTIPPPSCSCKGGNRRPELDPVSRPIPKNKRIWWRIHKWVKNTQKNLTPNLTSGSDVG